MLISKLNWFFVCLLMVPASIALAYENKINGGAEEYRFQESWPGPNRGSNDFILYVLKCKGNGYCGLAIEGYQVSAVVGMRVEEVDGRRKFIYVWGDKDNFGYHFKAGDVLFEMRQGEGGLRLTEWKELTPTLDENLRPGIYFRPSKKTEIKKQDLD